MSGSRPVPLRLQRLRQVHGATIRIVTEDDRAGGLPDGDGSVSTSPSVGLAVLTADCAAIALGSDEGIFAAVHAGWRGLLGGVVEAAAETMRGLGATSVHGAVGPTIHAECYPFSDVDLDSVAARYGDGVRSVSANGQAALDLPATVTAALAAAGVRPAPGVDVCTSCDDRYFSHRGRADVERQAMVVWSTAGHRG